MYRQTVEQYLHEHIPLSKAMAVSVREASAERVVLYAPLAPNINHRDTVFGGSASTLATLAAWSLLFVRLSDAALDGRIVIHANQMRYDRPMAGGFSAVSVAPDAADWARLVKLLSRNRMARIAIQATLECDGEQGGAFDGEFVILPPAPNPS